MALGALIAAYHDASGEGSELRATLPLAGRTLIEYQARLAAAAGAVPIVALVERMPATLVAAIDRLNAEGVAVQLARGAGEAAGYFEPDEQILIIAGGLFADAASIDRVASASGPAILTLADNIGLDGFERIDSASRWAGLALASGAQLDDTAATLGDWDLQSTLLRRLVQDGARQLAADTAGGAPMLLIAQGVRDLDDAERRIVSGARSARGDWVERYLTPILEEFAVERLMTTAVRPGGLLLGALVLTGAAALFFAKGWFGAALIALLVSVPLDGIAERLAALRMQPLSREDRLRRALPYATAAAMGGLGLRLAADNGDWGCVLAVATALAFFHSAAVERRTARAAATHWLASRKGSIMLALPFGAAGLWTTGLVTIALYAAGSFLWLQRRTHAPALAGKD